MTPSERGTRRWSFDLAVVFIVLLAAAFRLYRVDIPLLDAHSWRQVTNADITRHFSEGVMNPFVPRVSWGGRNGIVGMEFPLLHSITAIIWRVTGETHTSARLVTIAFSMTSVVLIYFLGARLFSKPVGRAAAFLFAVSPSLVYFGRAYLSDTPMVTFSIAAVLAWDRYFDRPGRRRASLAALLTALAALVKLPAILILAPIGGLALSRLGWAALRDRRLVAGCGVAVALVAAWYWYADRIYLDTGLTQAVFRPSGTYPADIAPDVAYLTTSHWSTGARLLSYDFWAEIIDRFWGKHLTPFGSLGALLGVAFVWRERRALPVLLWTLAGLALLVVSAEGNYNHEFHQLPLLPPLALLVGVAASPLFDGEYLKRFLPIRVASVVVALALLGVSVQAFRASNVLISWYRMDNLVEQFLAHGNFLQSVIPADALIVTVDYGQFGANSPMLLYYARRQGWSFDARTISPKVIDNLRLRHGARYFVSSISDELFHDRPDVRDYLRGFESVPRPRSIWQLVVVDLRAPRLK